jgi:hypothetical protein
MVRHFQQKTNVTCGAACYRILLSDIDLISEKQAVDEIGTKKSGTADYQVKNALKNRGIDFGYTYLGTNWQDYSHWLNLTSLKRKLYLSCTFKDKPCLGGAGRPRLRQHAICAINGLIYDPALKEPVPIEAYNEWTKDMVINSMIIIDME